MSILQKSSPAMCSLVKNGRNNGERGGKRRLFGWVCLGWARAERRGLRFYTVARTHGQVKQQPESDVVISLPGQGMTAY